MHKFKQIIVFILLGITMSGTSIAANAFTSDGVFTTVAGISVNMPNIKKLNCAEMREVLAEIDATGYRGAAPAPYHEEDQPLFNYETRIAEAHYDRCTSEKMDIPNSSENTFKRAFQKTE